MIDAVFLKPGMPVFGVFLTIQRLCYVSIVIGYLINNN